MGGVLCDLINVYLLFADQESEERMFSDAGELRRVQTECDVKHIRVLAESQIQVANRQEQITLQQESIKDLRIQVEELRHTVEDKDAVIDIQKFVDSRSIIHHYSLTNHNMR